MLGQRGPATHPRHTRPLSMPRDQLPSGAYHLDFLLLHIFITPSVSGPPGPSLWPSNGDGPTVEVTQA